MTPAQAWVYFLFFFGTSTWVFTGRPDKWLPVGNPSLGSRDPRFTANGKGAAGGCADTLVRRVRLRVPTVRDFRCRAKVSLYETPSLPLSCCLAAKVTPFHHFCPLGTLPCPPTGRYTVSRAGVGGRPSKRTLERVSESNKRSAAALSSFFATPSRCVGGSHVASPCASSPYSILLS